MTKGRAIAIAVIGIALTTILTLSIKYGKDNIKVQQVKANTTSDTIPTEYLQWTFEVDVINETQDDRYQMVNVIEEQLTDNNNFESDTYCTAQYIFNNDYRAIVGTLGFYNIPTEEDQYILANGTTIYYYNETTDYEKDIDINFKYKYTKNDNTKIIIKTKFIDNFFVDVYRNDTIANSIMYTANLITDTEATLKFYVIKPTENTKWYILEEYYINATSTNIYSNLDTLYRPNINLTPTYANNDIQNWNTSYEQDPSLNTNLSINCFDNTIKIKHTLSKTTTSTNGNNKSTYFKTTYNINTGDNSIKNRYINEPKIYSYVTYYSNTSINNQIPQNIYNQLMEKNSTTISNYYNLNTQIEVANTSIEQFNEEINSLQNDITDLNTEKEELETTITSLNSQKNNLATEIENLETEKEELETTITSLNSQIATLESNIEELEQDNADLSDQIDELEISVSNLQTANTTLQNQLNAVSVDKTELLATITTLNTEIDRLESIIDALTLDNEDIEEQLATAQATITSLNATITTLNTQKTNLENSITSLQANYNELSEEYETLETLKNNISDQLDALQEDFDELTASYEEFREEYGEYVENYENILTAYRELLDTGNGAIDIKGIMFDTLSMPFVFINKAFDITLFSGTAFAINIANLIKDILALLAILFLFGLFKKGLGAF